MSAKAPICLFVFNRLDHTRRTVEALAKNPGASESDLFIFSDGPRNERDREAIAALRTYLKGITGFRRIEIKERAENLGLANSIITGVTEVVNSFGRVIVMEDDLVTSPYFLTYMNEALALYADDPKVASIHGYVYPVEGLPETFFLKGADCWGWATWRGRWAHFNPDGAFLLKEIKARRLSGEFDFGGAYPYSRMLSQQVAGKNNSWAIRWHASAFLAEMVTLYPGRSLVFNIGTDDSGTHCSATHEFDVTLINRAVKLEKLLPVPSPEAFIKFTEYFRSTHPPLFTRVITRLKSRLFGGLRRPL
jgi:hypothetical protein